MARNFDEGYGEYFRNDPDFIEFLWEIGVKIYRKRDEKKKMKNPPQATIYCCANCKRKALDLKKCNLFFVASFLFHLLTIFFLN